MADVARHEDDIMSLVFSANIALPATNISAEKQNTLLSEEESGRGGRVASIPSNLQLLVASLLEPAEIAVKASAPSSVVASRRESVRSVRSVVSNGTSVAEYTIHHEVYEHHDNGQAEHHADDDDEDAASDHTEVGAPSGVAPVRTAEHDRVLEEFQARHGKADSVISEPVSLPPDNYDKHDEHSDDEAIDIVRETEERRLQDERERAALITREVQQRLGIETANAMAEEAEESDEETGVAVISEHKYAFDSNETAQTVMHHTQKRNSLDLYAAPLRIHHNFPRDNESIFEEEHDEFETAEYADPDVVQLSRNASVIRPNQMVPQDEEAGYDHVHHEAIYDEVHHEEEEAVSPHDHYEEVELPQLQLHQQPQLHDDDEYDDDVYDAIPPELPPLSGLAPIRTGPRITESIKPVYLTDDDIADVPLRSPVAAKQPPAPRAAVRRESVNSVSSAATPAAQQRRFSQASQNSEVQIRTTMLASPVQPFDDELAEELRVCKGVQNKKALFEQISRGEVTVGETLRGPPAPLNIYEIPDDNEEDDNETLKDEPISHQPPPPASAPPAVPKSQPFYDPYTESRSRNTTYSSIPPAKYPPDIRSRSSTLKSAQQLQEIGGGAAIHENQALQRDELYQPIAPQDKKYSGHEEKDEPQQPVSALLSMFGGGKRKPYVRESPPVAAELELIGAGAKQHSRKSSMHDINGVIQLEQKPSAPASKRNSVASVGSARSVIGRKQHISPYEQADATAAPQPTPPARTTTTSSPSPAINAPVPPPAPQLAVRPGYSYNPMLSPSFNPNFHDPNKFSSVRVVRNVRNFVKAQQTWGSEEFVPPKTPMSPTIAVWHEPPKATPPAHETIHEEQPQPDESPERPLHISLEHATHVGNPPAISPAFEEHQETEVRGETIVTVPKLLPVRDRRSFYERNAAETGASRAREGLPPMVNLLD